MKRNNQFHFDALNKTQLLPHFDLNYSLKSKKIIRILYSHKTSLKQLKGCLLWHGGAVMFHSPEALHIAVYDVGQSLQYSNPASHCHKTVSSKTKFSWGHTVPFAGFVKLSHFVPKLGLCCDY